MDRGVGLIGLREGCGKLTKTGERYMEKNFKLDDMIRIMKESHDFSARYIISLFFFYFFSLFWLF